jgi:hypothetical protein
VHNRVVLGSGGGLPEAQGQTAAGEGRRGLMGGLRGQAASAGGLGIDGVLEALRVEVQWGAGWSRGGILAEGLPFLFGAGG